MCKGKDGELPTERNADRSIKDSRDLHKRYSTEKREISHPVIVGIGEVDRRSRGLPKDYLKRRSEESKNEFEWFSWAIRWDNH